MNTNLTENQKNELEIRYSSNENQNNIHFGGYSYKCKCGFQFDNSAEINSFEIENVKYPFIINYQNNEGDIWFTVIERCPKCLQRCEFSDGN